MAVDHDERRVDVPGDRAVSARVARPAAHQPGHPVVILAHGAGTDMRHPSLAGFQDDLAAAGWPAVTFNFPYREAGRRAPDPRPVLVAAYRAVLDAVLADATLAPSWVAIGGRSMGGRMASHVAAEGGDVRGLLFLAFPLHAPGKPGVERAAHLTDIQVPMLFVQGTRDTLARSDLLASVLAGLPRATLIEIPEGDHSFRIPKKRTGLGAADVRRMVCDAALEWLERL